MPVFHMTRIALTSFLLFVWAASGCVQLSGLTRRVPARTQVPAPERATYWMGDGVRGAPKIVVGLEQQRAFFFKGRWLIAETGVSSGRNGFETPAGQYRVIQKDEKHVSNLYGDFMGTDGQIIRRNVDLSKDRVPDGAVFVGAPMPYFLRFSRGFGFHAGHLPGRPASHGCIRLPEEMARHFFETSDIGTPVRIEKSWLPEPVKVEPRLKLTRNLIFKPTPALKTAPKTKTVPRAKVASKGNAGSGGRALRNSSVGTRAGGSVSGWQRVKAWFSGGRGS
jgi:hypothetical protein